MVVKKLKTRVARKKNYKNLIGGQKNNLTFEPLSTTLPSEITRNTLTTEKPPALPERKRNKALKEIQIKHFWFKDWPDHGVPEDKTNFINFIDQVKNDIMKNGGTTVIHCSAGVGRTGVTMIALKMKFDNKITISEAINDARQGRMWIVQTNDQYNFLNEMFSDRLIHKKTFKNVLFGKKYTKTQPNFTELYNRTPNEKLGKIFYDLPKNCENQPIKNRYGNILPYEDTRVKLSQTNEPCSDYINANKFPNYLGDKLDVIATQCPTTNTINDFKRMLLQENVKRIVMVTNLSEGGRLKCNDYTGDLSVRSNKIKDYCLILNTDNSIIFHDSCSAKTINQSQQLSTSIDIKTNNKKRGLFRRMWNKITRKNQQSSNA